MEIFSPHKVKASRTENFVVSDVSVTQQDVFVVLFASQEREREMRERQLVPAIIQELTSCACLTL